jgi:hypothetical protein
MLRRLLGIVIGGVSYILLSWAIIFGPIVSGFFSGIAAGGGARRGFYIGLLSAALGFVALVAAMDAVGISVNNAVDALLIWVFVLANIFGCLLSALGGALGGMVAGAPAAAGNQRKQRPENIFHETAASVYVICPACGHSNGERDEYCRNCGKRILA